MANRFLHIGCLFTTFPKTEQVDRILDRTAPDWLRYSLTTWLVWTHKSSHELFMEMRPHLAMDDQVLIAEINLLERSGSLPVWVWRWIDAKLQGDDASAAQILRALAGPASR